MPKKPTYEELERKVKELEKVADELRKRSNVFLASDQEKEAILNNLMEHVIYQDTEMRILWANRAACESANLSYEKIVGRYCYEIWPKRNDPCSDCPVIRAMETGQPQMIEKSTPDGKYWLIRGYPFRDKNGDIKGGIEVTLEITEQKQAEEAIWESEKRFRSIIEVTEAGYFFIDKDGLFQDVNEAWLKMHHYSSSDEVIGQHFSLTQIDSDMEAANKNVKKLLTGEPFPTGEFSRRCKDGSIGYHTFTISPVVHGGEIIGLEGFIIDITDKKKLETRLRQAQKMEAIGTLAGGIAHDFNNILGIIIGNTELAIDDVPEWNPIMFNLQEILKASLRAKDVVYQLLSFASKTKLEKKPIDIIPLVKESLKFLRSSIPTSIELVQNITKNVGTILADPTQINQVLINLCTNANHAMPDGGIVEVSLKNTLFDEDTATQHCDLKPGQYVELTVRDTGHGIPQADMDHNRIFEPYFTTKEVGKGSGLGLAVVQSIVKSHKGTISVDSKIGEGTTVHIYFPVIEEEAVIETKSVIEPPTGNERILLVDDEESITYAGRSTLERLGYQVETRKNPVEALELFRSQPDQFDLIITDMTMPKMTGYKLTRKILNIRPDIPIILCSGFSEKINEKKAKEIGAAGYLNKPHDKRALAIRIRQVLDGK